MKYTFVKFGTNSPPPPLIHTYTHQQKLLKSVSCKKQRYYNFIDEILYDVMLQAVNIILPFTGGERGGNNKEIGLLTY